MSVASDPESLRTGQYRDSSNLRARIELHERFSANRHGWHEWVFEQLDAPADARILEVGCGPGMLWRKNRQRVPTHWELYLSDLSTGMVDDLRRNLPTDDRRVAPISADAQAIPFPDERFDVVIANHMLYHVPDWWKALGEMRRVLRRGGRFYASTVGFDHMRELRALVRRFDPAIPFGWRDPSERFALDNGLYLMIGWFPDVTLRLYEDALLVTEVEPLVAYVLSSVSGVGPDLTGSRSAEFRRFLADALTSEGVLRITKAQGLFVASR